MNRTAVIKKEKSPAKTYILYAAGGILLLGGSVVLTRHIVNKIRENRQHNQSFQEGSSATYAKQFKMAFDNNGWWGTDVPAVRALFRKIPSKDEFWKMTNSYQKLYRRNFIKDLTSELTNTEYNEMMSILATKPKKAGGAVPVTANAVEWAKRLKAAFDYTAGPFPATDEDAILAVFKEIPTQKAFAETAIAYSNLYGAKLGDDLSGELEWWEYSDFMQIIKDKPTG